MRGEQWNDSMENMLDPERSTEKLTATATGAPVDPEPAGKKRSMKPLWVLLISVIVVLAIAGAVVGALIAKHVINVNHQSTTPAQAAESGSPTSAGPSNGAGATGTGIAAGGPSSTSTPKPVACTSAKDIPSSAKGTWQDPTSWLDLTDFNCTFTDETVGGLPLVGLNSTWDDSTQANPNVPPLNKPWGSYANTPFRGVSIGGWLALEPFITPSLFATTDLVDEWTLCSKLGPKQAAATLEKHYSTFITEDDFQGMAKAGLDHVRIPYSYWAIKTYPNDPYVFGVSWRYLLRGIEWARKYGLRVKLDLHGVPGSQNGWNHSGKQGKVDWISGPDGATNAQRTLDLHTMLAQFFAQDRYKNIVVMYGLVNEPAQSIPMNQLIDWTEQAYDIVKKNGVDAIQVFSESMRGLPPWQGKLTGYGDSLVVDVHEYTVFDDNLTKLKHADRVNFACSGWTSAVEASINTATGFGPTMVGEWSQADTDCTLYLNGVGNGARWTGTFDGPVTPACPTQNNQCSCDVPNADPSTFSDAYKSFLQTWAEAQMSAFEKGWGWFYWTWKTETAALWSYQAALAGGFMPALAYKRDWDCSNSMPSFAQLPEYY